LGTENPQCGTGHLTNVHILIPQRFYHLRHRVGSCYNQITDRQQAYPPVQVTKVGDSVLSERPIHCERLILGERMKRVRPYSIECLLHFRLLPPRPARSKWQRNTGRY
jgi:hypothetical protein